MFEETRSESLARLQSLREISAMLEGLKERGGTVEQRHIDAVRQAIEDLAERLT
jgi:hypothetical protein